MWTTNQEDAIKATCADNIVSAAAGSGKTAVLVERIISRVLAGDVDIDRLLVVTFTNAAAAEMKSRLMSKIMEKLSIGENQDYLNRQLMLINNASICTIDSFCLNVLRNNFYKIGLDPAVKVADAAELELLKSDLLNEIIEEYYANKDEIFLKIVNSYTGRKDTELAELILQIFNFSLSLPDGMDDVDKLKANFRNNSVWENYFVKKAHGISKKAIEYYQRAIRVVEFSTETEDNFRSLHAEKNYFENVLSANSWDKVYNAVLCFEFPRFTPHKSLSITEKEEVKFYRNAAKDLYKSLCQDFSVSSEDLCADISETADILDKFIEITGTFSQRFTTEKRAKGLMDFSDVEHLMLKLLKQEDGSQSDTAITLMNKFDEIYVDEFQDCNSVQAEIFRLISRENILKPNMFRVGDMKQSIYGFRGAEPAHFKRALAKCNDKSEPEGYRKKIILNKNFRSRKSIIDAVNSVFSQIMSDTLGDIDYNEDEYLYYEENSYDDVNDDLNRVDFTLIDTDISEVTDTSEESGSFEELKDIEAEAIFVANKINEIVNDENYIVYDKPASRYRKAKFSDIVILLRSGGEKAAAFNRILSLASIPVYCEMGDGYYESGEVVFLTNFLKIIDNPFDDIALLSVMRHPVIGFTDDEFVSVRLSKTKGYFYKSILSYVKNNQDELSSKLQKFLGMLKNYYESSKYLSCDRLIWKIIQDTDYMAYLSFTGNAELRKANVKALLTRAYEFEKSSYKGIFDFIRYVDSVRNSSKDAEPAKTLSDDEDVVRIMTIHKSKGLEFPIVFLCNSTKQFNDTDIRMNKIITHPEVGFGLNFYDFDNYYYYELPQKKHLKEIKRREMLSEEMRVLYVALTRAREKLIITGTKKKAETYLAKFEAYRRDNALEVLKDSFCDVKSYSDWIVSSMVLNDNYSADDSKLFKMQIINKRELILNVEEGRADFMLDVSDVTAEECEAVKKRLMYTYPHSALAKIPSNMSVTELKKLEMSDENAFMLYSTTKVKNPNFYSQNNKFSAADIGTFTHLVMEKLDFSKVSSLEDISLQLEELIMLGFLTRNQADTIKTDNIFRILNTDIGKMMRDNHQTLKREFSFKYLMNADELNGNVVSDEKIVVQGMIDAYFEDSFGNVIIVDYKTDKVVNTPEEIRDRYLAQMKYYKIAIEKISGKKVAGAYLFLLDSGDVMACDV